MIGTPLNKKRGFEHFPGTPREENTLSGFETNFGIGGPPTWGIFNGRTILRGKPEEKTTSSFTGKDKKKDQFKGGGGFPKRKNKEGVNGFDSKAKGRWPFSGPHLKVID